MFHNMTKKQAIDALMDDKMASWTQSEATALIDWLADNHLETLELDELRDDWLAFKSGIEALEYFNPKANHENNEDYASEWLHELTGTVDDIIWHSGGVLVSPCHYPK